ncbi:filamentous hemagglutinin N-terminal domain-containing protein, partial [Moorena sp. SIO1F2]|uniref:two-partner secretion domain-containing protein n=1 Tax=Moorena sp. SIO1F2 TaxID=2607819 RepID=UPI0025CCA981
MKPRIDQLVAASPFVLCSLLGATTALGQITPDNTLGKVSSVVTPNVTINGALADLIEGGAIRDSNLFHSFSDFNVAEFGRVYFANPAGVANILSRVTGTNVSNILGTLGVLGNANLFLINPNGIVFGSNSRLDLGGSFFGSTADSILFDDGTVFSAKNPNDKPLLTINIPSGLQYGSNPGSITNQSSLFLVPNGQTLGLIGGEVTIPGGLIAALDGRIELGSVGNGVVNLTPTDTSFVLDYSAVPAFQDISLSDGAFVITSGESGGSIQVQGANVSLRDRSFVFANTEGSGSGGGIVVDASQLSLEGGSQITTNVIGSGQGGDLTVDASESVRVVGVSPDSIPSILAALVFPEATGNGGDVSITTGELIVSDGAFVATTTRGEGDAGDVSITTGELIVKDGAFVSTSTSGEGDGGNLTVDADSTVELSSDLFAQTAGKGNAGDVSITTDQLIVKDGAFVLTSTFGEGDGGNLTVDADSTVQLIGTSASGEFASSFLTQTLGKGKAGDVSITTGEFIVSDGARISARTLGEGDGGNVTVDADSTVQLIGTSASGEFASSLLTRTLGKGKAGDVSITTGEFIVSDGAIVSASTFSEGDGGDINVNASSTVELSSDLLAQANSGSKGNGGDISITTDQGMSSVRELTTSQCSYRTEGSQENSTKEEVMRRYALRDDQWER